MAVEIYKSSKVVSILTAQARKEHVDSADAGNTTK